MPAVGVSDADLVALFTGDEFSQPYPTERLAEEICRRLQPGDVQELRLKVYGSWPLDEISTAALRALTVGFHHWWRAGRPR